MQEKSYLPLETLRLDVTDEQSISEAESQLVYSPREAELGK